MKICSSCNRNKNLEEFYIDRRNKQYGRSSRCKECAKQASKQWYSDSEDYRKIIRNSGLKKRFGISDQDYLDLLEIQGGVCYICKTKGLERNLHVDHNHISGEIRGLLCKQCNHGLGNFKDNKEYLKSAIEYLDRNSVGN